MQRFEFVEGTSSKFWEVTLAGTVLTTRWGKIGGSISMRENELASVDAAVKERDRMIREKTGKGYREVGNNTAKPAKPTGGIKPSELVLTTLREAGRGGRLSRIAIDGHRVLASGNYTVASTDGKKFYPRVHYGDVFALHAMDGAFYACGGPFAVTRDLGQTWKEIAVPAKGYRFTIARDSTATWWLGCDEGLVLTSKQPDKGWKKAPFRAFGKVLWVLEVDGKLLFAGADSGVWDGKRFQRLKGMKKTDVITRITESPAGTLIAVGDGGIGYRSMDRGASWKPIKTGAKDDLEDCAWVAGALIVVGGSGLILKSTNDGASFTKIKTTLSYQKLWGIASWGAGAFIGGDGGVLYKLASPNDPYWKGATDELAPPPPAIDPNFTPRPAAKNREVAYAKQHADALAAYKPTTDKRPPDANPALTKLVDADADASTDALDVYADWLQGQGDPRGELAALQLKLAAAPKDKALLKAEKALLKTHAEALLGPFAKLSDVVTLEWRGGFLRAARIANSFDRDPDYGDGTEDSKVDIEALTGQLLDHPSARFLRELTVGLVGFEENSYDGIAKVIGKRHLPALRTLYLGDFSYEETELSWSDLGNLQPLYAAVPNLRSLRLRSGSVTFGKILHPALEHFEIITGGLDPKAAKAIASAVWPSLVSLSLMVGRERYGGTTSLKDLRPILAGENLPRLRSLALKNLEFTDDLVEVLASSAILPQLTSLDLSMGTLSDDGVRRLYRYQKAFQHLESLNLSESYISKDGIKLLKQMKLAADTSRQRDDGGDPGDRYAAVGE